MRIAFRWSNAAKRFMVSRTLSKSYGLAGLRFGYLMAQPHVIEQLSKVKDSYNCDALSIAAATAAIGDQVWFADNRVKILASRATPVRAARPSRFFRVTVASQLSLVHPPRTTVRAGLRATQICTHLGPIYEVSSVGRGFANLCRNRRTKRRADHDAQGDLERWLEQLELNARRPKPRSPWN